MSQKGGQSQRTLRSQTRKRKEQYREILQKGHSFEDNVENTDVIESLNAVQKITDKCKELLSECRETETVEAVAEVILSAKVRLQLISAMNPSNFLSFKVIKMNRELFSGTLKKISESKFPEENFIAEIVSCSLHSPILAFTNKHFCFRKISFLATAMTKIGRNSMRSF